MKILTARPRLHVGLADMGFVSARAYGGVGFSVDRPETILEFNMAARVTLCGFESLDKHTQNDLQRISERIAAIARGRAFSATLRALPPQHVGFGTKTTLALSLLAGVNALLELGLTRTEMQRLSGRGGASGIGMHAFYDGGVIWDCGHSHSTGIVYTPSSISEGRSIPPLMLRLTFPHAWRVVLVLCEEPSIHGDSEALFFSENAPVSATDALMTMAALYHGVLPAIRLADIRALANALRTVHEIGFKQREVRARSNQTQTILAELQTAGLAAGMSSMGPLVYAIIPMSDSKAFALVENVCRDCGTQPLAVVRGYEGGYDIRTEPDK